jgi:hypothetical protein
MEKDTTKLWNLTKTLNDEGSKSQKITLEDQGRTITGKAAANGYESPFSHLWVYFLLPLLRCLH